MTSEAEAALLQLRDAVKPLPLSLLSKLWDNYVRTGEWATAHEFHHLARGPTAAKELFQSLGGAVIWRSEEPDSRYNLTPLGALLTSRGSELERLLVQWLFYLKQRYWDDPNFSQVGVEDAREPLKLKGDQDAHIGRLIALSSALWGQSGSGQMPWHFGPPHNIDELAEKSPSELVEYLHDKVMADYLQFGKDLPIDGRDRSAALMRVHLALVPSPDDRLRWRIVDTSEQQLEPHAESIRTEIKPKKPRVRKAPPTTRAPRIDFSFVVDADLRRIIEQDYGEAHSAVQHGLHKAAALLLGSVAEGLLLDLLQRLSVAGLTSYKSVTTKELPQLKGGGINWDMANLEPLTRVAESLGLIHTTRAHLLRGMRDFRNTVHPRSELREKNRPNESDAGLLVAAVVSLVEQIRQVK